MKHPRFGKLAPCPRCGGENLKALMTSEPGDPHLYTYAVTCLDCGFAAPATHEATEAAPIWNKRLEERKHLTCLGCEFEPPVWRHLKSRPGSRVYGLCQVKGWSCGVKMVIHDTKTGRLFCHRARRGREECPMFVNEFSICHQRRPRQKVTTRNRAERLKARFERLKQTMGKVLGCPYCGRPGCALAQKENDSQVICRECCNGGSASAAMERATAIWEVAKE